MAKRWGAETFFLPEIWQEFARPGYSVVPGDPSGPDGIIDGTQPRRNDLRSITHRLKKFDFVFVLRSDDTHYWLDWHIWRAGATAAESVLVSGHEANIDRLKIEIADAMRKRDDLGLDDLVWEFEIFWTTKEKHTDFTGAKVIQGDYIIYAARRTATAQAWRIAPCKP